MFVIAIDGPAASGKSTTATMIAKKLNFERLDSGLLYRAITYLLLRNGLIKDICSEEAMRFVNDLKISQINGKVFYNGEDITEFLRTDMIDIMVVPVAKELFIRNMIHEIQHHITEALEGHVKGIVIDGRDITTVVFPNADLKIFITADQTTRARRRAGDQLENYCEILENLKIRDDCDINREHGPLRLADDASYLDNSDLSLDQTVESIIELYNLKISDSN